MPIGRTGLYQWGNTLRSITSLLNERRIFNIVPGNTYGSKRESIRRMLRSGELTYGRVMNLPDIGRTPEAEFYGSQRRRANLPLRRTTGEVIQGPRLTHDEDYDGPFDPNEPPRVFRGYGGFNKRNDPGGGSVSRIGKGLGAHRNAMVVNGKALGARRALEMHPFLRKHVMQKGRSGVKDSTLVRRLRRMHREEGIPSHLVTVGEARIIQDMNHRIRSNIVSHHNLVNPDRTLSVLEFLDSIKEKVKGFLSDNSPVKAQLILRCQFLEKDESSPSRFFRTRQHVVLASTDMEELYDTIRGSWLTLSRFTREQIVVCF